MNKITLSLFLLATLAGCSMSSADDGIALPLKIKTAQALKLHSSSEITVNNVSSDHPEGLQPHTIFYRVTTNKNQSYHCQSKMFPGMAGQETIYTPPVCQAE